MVREAFPGRRAQVVAAAAALLTLFVVWTSVRAQAAVDSSGAAAVADALLWGHTMPPPEATAKLPGGVQRSLLEYRRREEEFKSGLTPPPGATPEEQAVFEQRVGIERVVFCLFPRRDSARIASLYALDVDVSLAWEGAADLPRREAAFINQLLSDLPIAVAGAVPQPDCGAPPALRRRARVGVGQRRRHGHPRRAASARGRARERQPADQGGRGVPGYNCSTV